MSYDIRKWAENSVRNQPRRPWVGRVLIVLLVVATSHALWTTAQGGSGAGAPPLLLFALGLAAASPFARANVPLWGRTDTLDEFERAALDRANRLASLIVGGALLAGLGWLRLATDHGWPIPADATGWATWFDAAGVAVLTLPTAIAELTTPILPMDGEDERL